MSFHYARLLTVGAVAAFACVPVFAENITPDLQFNGYATAGAAWTNNAHGAQYLFNSTSNEGISSDPSLDNDSIVGLQFNYRVNDRTHLVTQLTASQGNGDFAVKANWAYIAYQLNDDFTVRAGRFAFPTYLYSENLNVGEAYPWARLPSEIYGTLGGLYNLNGIDLLYRKPIGDWNLTVQPVLGTASLTGYQVNNMRGLTVNLSNDNLTLHAGTMLADVNIDFTSLAMGQATLNGVDAELTAGGMAAAIPTVNAELSNSLNLQNDRASYSDLGLVYDDGKWFAAGELAQLRFKGWPTDFNSGYASVGHYFGQFLPYVLYSRISDVNNDENMAGFASDPISQGVAASIAQGSKDEQNTVAVGVRYQVRSGVSVKAQVDHIAGFKGDSGLFSFGSATPVPLSAVYLYSLSLNVAF